MSRRHNVVLALTVFAVAGCAARSAPPATKAGPLTDAEIAAIVVAANAIDADLGDLAAGKTQHQEVRSFAQTMATGHRAINRAAAELVTRLNVQPVENAVSRQLQADAAAVRTRLAQEPAASFDRAYLAHEVEYHRAVLNAIDELLLPQAQNAELKQAITDVRPAIAGHLTHAEQLLKQLP